MGTGPVFAPPCGPIQGWTDGEVTRATGIPYAVGPRFTRPVPAPDREDLLLATTWSPACPQNPVPLLEHMVGAMLEQLEVDENCQHLSVTLPADAEPGDSLPVMVWIHGGSYVTAAGDLPNMDPAALVAEQRVIVVTVTYRLGLFGFLGGRQGRPANLGLLDQREAFRWVQRNIAAFGGNPREVTAFGQSAGADAVAHLMATGEAPSLFRRAIIQSSPFGVCGGRAAMNAAMNDAAAAIDPEASAQEILDHQVEVQQAASGFGPRSMMPFGPQYGYEPLPPEDSIEQGWDAAAPTIDLLIGHTAQEVAAFVPRLPALHRISRVPLLGPMVSRAAVAALTKRLYSAGSRQFAQRHARAGGVAHHYVISWSPPGSRWGSAHMVDLPLLFGDEVSWQGADLVRGTPWADIDRPAKQVRALWAGFARGEDLGNRGSIPHTLSYRRVETA